MKSLALFVLACTAATCVALSSAPLRGTFALQGGGAKTDAYLLAESGKDPLSRRLDLWLTPPGSNVAIRSYDVEMTKFLHAVIVSDDFRTFLHVHPALQLDGHFVLEQQLPRPTLYHLYADGDPHGIGQQVFRFDMQAGPPMADDPGARDLSERDTTCRVDGYTVTLSTLALKAGGESKLDVHVTRDGKPATDLDTYLGALAHAVFIDAEDLTYVHAHPVPYGSADDDDMGGTKMSGMQAMTGMTGMAGMNGMNPGPASAPDMTLHVRVIEPGTYKLWLQFAGGAGLHVAQFVLEAA